MSTERWQQVEPIFLHAESLPVEARAEYLDGACAGDADLRTEVESLLGASTADTWDEESRPAPASVDGEGIVPTRSVGRRLGPWSLGALIGSGGMGEVYEAQRADGAFELKVAIKLLKRGLDTQAVLARFARERRILAQISHPNVAHVLDAGMSPDGRPFLAMEYVAGTSITEYVRDQSLDTPAILRLMITVCEAVQAAHSRQIIHRDLKPSNILVTREGQVKLLDFGIAKALEEEAPDSTRLAGELIALTPAYAAPEQILGLSASTRSDVYSLGVVLYQLLTESLPHRRSGRSTAEIARNLDQETVLKPSTVLRRERGKLPEPLRIARLKTLKSDLDLIVLKAMHAVPDRRYENAQAFADDLHRLLANHSVAARPDSIFYRSNRFVRRNRLMVTAATLLLIGMLTTTAMYFRANAASRRAELSAKDANDMSDFLLKDVLAPLDASKNDIRQMAAIKPLLDSATTKIDPRFKDRPLPATRIRMQLAGTYASLGDAEKASQLLHRIYNDARDAAKVDAPESFEFGMLMLDLGGSMGDILFTGPEYWIALERQADDRLAPDDPRRIPLESIAGLAEHELLHDETARAKLVAAVDQARKLDDKNALSALGKSLDNLSSFYNDMGETQAFLSIQREILARDLKRGGPQAGSTLNDRLSLASEDIELGRYAEAEDLINQSLTAARMTRSESNPYVLKARFILGSLRTAQERYEEARTILDEALATYEAQGPHGENLDDWKQFVALQEMIQGRTASAEEKFSQLVSDGIELRDPYRQNRIYLAETLSISGRVEEAKVELAKLSEASLRLIERSPPNRLDLERTRGLIAAAEGHTAEAVAQFTKELETADSTWGADSLWTHRAKADLSQFRQAN